MVGRVEGRQLSNQILSFIFIAFRLQFALKLIVSSSNTYKLVFFLILQKLALAL